MYLGHFNFTTSSCSCGITLFNWSDAATLKIIGNSINFLWIYLMITIRALVLSDYSAYRPVFYRSFFLDRHFSCSGIFLTQEYWRRNRAQILKKKSWLEKCYRSFLFTNTCEELDSGPEFMTFFAYQAYCFAAIVGSVRMNEDFWFASIEEWSCNVKIRNSY